MLQYCPHSTSTLERILQIWCVRNKRCLQNSSIFTPKKLLIFLDQILVGLEFLASFNHLFYWKIPCCYWGGFLPLATWENECLRIARLVQKKTRMKTDLAHLLIFIDSILCGACDLGLTRNYTDLCFDMIKHCSTFLFDVLVGEVTHPRLASYLLAGAPHKPQAGAAWFLGGITKSVGEWSGIHNA